MRTIYKYKLAAGVGATMSLLLPRFSNIVHFAYVNEQFFIWVDHELDNLRDEYLFDIVGTGWPIKNGRHAGTVIHNGFVWHLLVR